MISPDKTIENQPHVQITTEQLLNLYDDRENTAINEMLYDPMTGDLREISIGLPTEAEDEGSASGVFDNVQIPISLYRVGNEMYVTGWSLNGSDQTLAQFCTDNRFAGKTITIGAQIDTPSINVSKQDEMAPLMIELTDTDEFIDLKQMKKQRKEVERDQAAMNTLHGRLLVDQLPIFEDQLRDENRWRHQPAVLLAIGDSLKQAEEKDQTLVGWVGSPTGTGKTRIEAQLLETALKAGITKPIFVTSRRHLLDQSREKIEAVLPDRKVTTVDGRYKNVSGEIITTTYNSLPTVLQMLQRQGVSPGLVVWDEAHNLLHNRKHLIRHELLENSIQIGFTATPGMEHTLSDIGMEPIVSVPLAYTIESGCTPPIIVQRAILKMDIARDQSQEGAVSLTEKIDDASIEDRLTIEAKINLLERESLFMQEDGLHVRPTLIEAQTLSEANELGVRITELLDTMESGSGARVGIISSEQTDTHNRTVLAAADTGEIDIVIGVDMISEGIDLPRFEVIILKPWQRSQYRPIQDAGRVMRVTSGGNPCKIVEIWPFSNADQLGYRSVLELLGVKEGDPRISFTGRKEYEERLRRIKALSAEYDIPDGLADSPYFLEQEILIATPRLRDRSLEKVITLPDIGSAIVPIYLKHLLEGGQPIVRMEYRKGAGLSGVVDENVFQDIVGFRWRLIPYFRLSQSDIRTLTRVMYHMEVVAEMRYPLSILEEGTQFEDYTNELYQRVRSNNEEPTREEIIVQMMEDFSIVSTQYTLKSVLADLRRAGALGADVDSAVRLGERILVREHIRKYQSRLPWLRTRTVENGGLMSVSNVLSVPTEHLFNEIDYAVSVRISQMIDQVQERRGIYTVDGTRFENEPIYEHFQREMGDLIQFLETLKGITHSLRFKSTYFTPADRRNYLTVVHEQALQNKDYLNLTVPLTKLLRYTIIRLQMLGYTDAESIASMDEDDIYGLLLIPERRFQSRVESAPEGISWSDFLSIAARYIDPEYAKSHDVWQVNTYNELIENLVICIQDAELSLEEIKALSASSLLGLRVEDRDVIPPIYVSIPMYLRSDGRGLSSFKAYCKRLNKRDGFNGVTPGRIMNDVKLRFGIQPKKKKKK